MDIEKTRLTAGADEKSPSLAQYFSWINNTNEGSTQEQTLINLNYFKWLHDEYGMQLDIYAWDAGNLDGSRESYQTPDGEKLKKQYPQGYKPIADLARSLGVRMGVWCGPDGFGDTEADAKKRTELMVSLCRDFGFALFKIDGVCGQLRESKRPYFVEMMKQCRKYQPDLVLLNHRLELGIGMPYATTFLWEGVETYIDVHVANKCTAPHNRAYFLFRNSVPGNQRLAEDHGVCISSCLDYFDDDLIYQAFNRCLILAPEIYGNPWLLSDGEHRKLANIYNLHRKYRDILVNGVVLPSEYTPNSNARGDGKRQFVTLGNGSWDVKKVKLHLGKEIGLAQCKRAAVIMHHPYERFVGIFDFGAYVNIDVMPFRAALIEVCDVDICSPVLTGCEYERIKGEPDCLENVKLVSVSDKVNLLDVKTGNVLKEFDITDRFDNTLKAPVWLSHAESIDVPDNANALIEATLFCADNDSLEARALKRSGESSIPQVRAAREAFFNQKTYLLRGCESKYAFDGREDTFFDGASKNYYGGMRIHNGCLRVDFGECCEADGVLIEYFSSYEDTEELDLQKPEVRGSYSEDLSVWHDSELMGDECIEKMTMNVLKTSLHTVLNVNGERKRAEYSVKGNIRYFRLPSPVDRIFKIALLKEGKEITPASAKAGNLFDASCADNAIYAKAASVNIGADIWREGCSIAVALNGKCQNEGAYVAALIDGKPLGFPERAPSYPANAWECPVRQVDGYYTYFLPITQELKNKKIDVYVLGLKEPEADYGAEVYLAYGYHAEN